MAEFDRGIVSKEQEVIVKHTLYTDGTTNTVSMGELVRCKDCKHHHYQHGIPYCDRIDYGYGWQDNDFCSYGERGER